MKRQHIKQKKVFANHKSDKGLTSTTYKGLTQLNSKKQNKTEQKS